jgi:hypothetical protein
VLLIPHDNGDDQALALIEGRVDLAQIVFPDTDRLSEHSALRHVPHLDRREEHKSIAGDIANVIVCRQNLIDHERTNDLLRFIRRRNLELAAMESESPMQPTGQEISVDVAVRTTLHESLEFVTGELDEKDVAIALTHQFVTARKNLPNLLPDRVTLEMLEPVIMRARTSDR